MSDRSSDKDFSWKISHEKEIQEIVKNSKKEKTFQCTVCDQTFTYKHNLNSHYSSIHVNTKSFECGLCSKTFESQKCLQQHISFLHKQDSRNIVCEVC